MYPKFSLCLRSFSYTHAMDKSKMSIARYNRGYNVTKLTVGSSKLSQFKHFVMSFTSSTQKVTNFSYWKKEQKNPIDFE